MSSQRKSLPGKEPSKRTGLEANSAQEQPTRTAHSAGGVAYRKFSTESGDQIRIALISTGGGTRWQLPKGTIEAGESPETTAVREVEEETGLKTVNEGFLKSTNFWYQDTYNKSKPVLVHKRVDFFLLRVIGGKLSDQSYEVDGVAWFTPKSALAHLTFDDEQEVVKLAQVHWT
jgi:8-oxo-dGTP pyrophosphatase MutT (NUDIX family)